MKSLLPSWQWVANEGRRSRSMTIAHGDLHLQIMPFSTRLWSRIESEWDSLLVRCQSSSAFMSSAWMQRWLIVFGETMRPDTLVWRDDRGVAVAVCLVTIRRERRGPFTVRRAYLNATGEHLVASEHNVILCLPAWHSVVCADIIAFTRARGADSIMMSGFSVESRDCIQRLWPKNGLSRGFASDDRFVALKTLRASGSDYLSTLSRSSREQIRRSIRIYREQFGNPVVEIAGSPQRAAKLFQPLRGWNSFAHCMNSAGFPEANAGPSRASTFSASILRLCGRTAAARAKPMTFTWTL